MSYELFWFGDPKLFNNYLDAYNQRKKQEMEEVNFTSWLNGWYIDKALACNHPLAKKKIEYMKEPIDISAEKKQTTKKKITQKEKEDFEQKLALQQFEQFEKYVDVYNKTYFGGEGGK